MRYRMAVLMAPMLLIGCNFVFSDHPWFGEADAAGAPPLRDGLWAVLETADCAFDDSQPADKWPECADAMVVEGGRLVAMDWTMASDGTTPTLSGADAGEIVLAAGNPRVLQYRSLGKDGGEAKPDQMWSYVGIRPTAQDSARHITAFNRWIVQCGPPPPPGGPDVTRRPFRGMTISGTDCIASSQAALRNAAARSEHLRGKSGQAGTPPAHWVREGRI